jgi:hypothetical protein
MPPGTGLVAHPVTAVLHSLSHLLGRASECGGGRHAIKSAGDGMAWVACSDGSRRGGRAGAFEGLFIQGPYDDARRVMSTLERTVGKGNLHFTVTAGDPRGWAGR